MYIYILQEILPLFFRYVLIVLDSFKCVRFPLLASVL